MCQLTWGRPGRRVRRALAATLLPWLALPEASAAHPQSTLDSESSAASEIEELWWFMLIAATVVVAVVLALVLLAVLKRRGRSDRAARWIGRDGLISLGGVVVPIAILSVLFALTLDTLQASAPGHLHPELTVKVTARQWFWDVRYPERRRAITANEIHVPAGVPVEVELRTRDVLHSFWVPALNRKVDAVPGRTTRVTFQLRKPGVYRGQCAEFCGAQHANMALRVIAEEPRDFRRWLERQARPAAEPSRPSEREGRDVFMSEGCASCHTIRGTEASTDIGPDLTHLASRLKLAAETIDNERGDLGGWILDPQGLKPGTKMPGTQLSGDQLQALLDYLQSLR